MASPKDLHPLKKALIGIGLLIGALPVALVVFFFVYGQGYRVPSSSMEPTLHCARPQPGCEGKAQDHVVALRYRWPLRGPRHGDLVVFRTPAPALRCGMVGTYVKRLVALPGETFAERNGVVYVNGRRLREPYVNRRDVDSLATRRVPAGSYFVLRDARSQSCDLRVWGAVPRGSLIARVVAVYWPPARVGLR